MHHPRRRGFHSPIDCHRTVSSDDVSRVFYVSKDVQWVGCVRARVVCLTQRRGEGEDARPSPAPAEAWLYSPPPLPMLIPAARVISL